MEIKYIFEVPWIWTKIWGSQNPRYYAIQTSLKGILFFHILKCGEVGSFKNHDLYLDAVSTEKTSRTAFEAEIVEMTFFSANFGQFRDVSVYNPDAAE